MRNIIGNRKGQFVEYVAITILGIMVLILVIFWLRTQGDDYVKSKCIGYMQDKSVKITIPAKCPDDLIVYNNAENLQYFFICDPKEMKTITNITNSTKTVKTPANTSEVYVLTTPMKGTDQQFTIYYKNGTKKYLIGSKSGIYSTPIPPIPIVKNNTAAVNTKKWYQFWK